MDAAADSVALAAAQSAGAKLRPLGVRDHNATGTPGREPKKKETQADERAARRKRRRQRSTQQPSGESPKAIAGVPSPLQKFRLSYDLPACGDLAGAEGGDDALPLPLADGGYFPEHLLLEVFSFILGTESLLGAACLTCVRWAKVVDSPSLWQSTEDETAVGSIEWTNFKNQGIRNKGTEGSCFKCYQRSSQMTLCMKRARVYPDGEGVPYYMLRELAFLKGSSHPNIANLKKVNLYKHKLCCFFEFIETTLHDTINPTSDVHGGRPLKLDTVKSYMYQLLCGVAYCHSCGVLHRNLKPKHILVNPSAEPGAKLKISDFALVRLTSVPKKCYTTEVVTLWYRAPEILMGGEYHTPVDVWSAACIFAEMVTGQPLFIGISEVGQLFQIFSKLGTPSKETWAGMKERPNYSFAFPNWPQRHFSQIFPQLANEPLAVDLISKMMAFDPAMRISAQEALNHPYFHDLPENIRTVASRGRFQGPPREDLPAVPSNGPPPRVRVDTKTAASLNAHQFRTSYEAFLRGIEKSNGSRPENVMVLQDELHGTHRAMLVDWLIEVVDVFQMSLRSAFLAVGYVDIMLGEMKLTRANFQLLGATCLHIASKCEDVSYIGVEDLANCGDNIYTQKKLLEREEMVLNKLDFHLCLPTMLDAVNLLLDRRDLAIKRQPEPVPAGEAPDAAELAAQEEDLFDQVKTWAHYASELALQECRFCKYSPFKMGAMLLLYARKIAGIRPVWCPELAEVTGFEKADLQQITEAMHEVHLAAEFTQLQAVRKRYTMQQRRAVATVLPPTELNIRWQPWH